MGLANLANIEWEYTRTGNYYMGGCNIVADGIAPVADFPTTTAGLALYNANEIAGGRCLIIDRASLMDSSGTPAAGATLVGCVTALSVADASKPTSNAAGYANINLLGGRPDASGGLWGTGVTIPSSKWFIIGSNLQLAAANVGQGIQAFQTLMIIPPRYAAGFAIVSGAGTTPLYAVTVRFATLPLELDNAI